MGPGRGLIPDVVAIQVVTITANDFVNTSSVTFTINAVPVTPTLTITSGNRTYDRTAYAAVATLSGSATPSPAITFAYFSDSAGTQSIAAPVNAGTYYVRASVAANANNSAAESPLTAFTIERATLVATVTVSNKIFDNTNSAVILTRSLSGILGTDVVSVGGGVATFVDALVGTNKTVHVSGLGLIGEASANYLSNTTTTATADIIARGIIQARSTRYLRATGAGNNGASSSLATDKVALLPGQSSSFSNYTNYSRGLNSVVIDMENLPTSTTPEQMLASLQFAQWNGIGTVNWAVISSTANPAVSFVPGGVGSSSRVQIAFVDNTIQNTWLRVTVLSGLTTALTANDVFYFGNVIGEINTGNTATRLRVNATDTGAVRSNQSTAANSASVTNIFDVNRDGRVNATDTGIVRSNQQTAGIVAPLTVPGAIPPVGAFGMPPQPVVPKKPGGEPDQGGEVEMGGSVASGVDSTLVPTPDLGTLLVSRSNTPSTIGQGLMHNGLEHALSNRTVSAVLLPQNQWSVLAATTFASFPTDKKSSEDQEREIVDDLFAGLAKENLSDFFS